MAKPPACILLDHCRNLGSNNFTRVERLHVRHLHVQDRETPCWNERPLLICITALDKKNIPRGLCVLNFNTIRAFVFDVVYTSRFSIRGSILNALKGSNAHSCLECNFFAFFSGSKEDKYKSFCVCGTDIYSDIYTVGNSFFESRIIKIT